MADSTFLKIPLLSTSQSAKETTINTMVSYLERAMNDAQNLSLAAGSVSLSETDLARFFVFRLTGVVSGRTITIPNLKRLFVVENLTGGFTVDLVRGANTLTIPVGGTVVVYCDGANLISVADSTVTGGGGGGATSFIALVDTFPSYADLAGQFVRVKALEDGLEAVELKVADLTDVDLTDVAEGYILTYDATALKWVAVENTAGGGGGSSSALKQAVRVATTEEMVIDTQIVVGFTIDGVTLVEGDRVLVKDQTAFEENGIWQVTGSTPVRPTDANSSGDITQGTMVLVVEGLLGTRLLYTQTAPDIGGINPGSSPMIWRTSSVTLSSLTDVDVSTPPIGGQVLIWDEVNSLWNPGDVTAEADLPSKVGNAGKVLAVNSTEDDVEWVDGGSAEYPDMTGNSGKVLAVNSTEDDVEWVDQSGGGSGGVPILSIFYPGETGDAETIYRWTAPVVLNLPIGLTGSKFTAGVAATTSTVFTLKKNGTDIGTITFAASGTTGTVSFTGVQVFNTNDTLTIVGPVTADTTLADLSMSFKGTA